MRHPSPLETSVVIYRGLAMFAVLSLVVLTSACGRGAEVLPSPNSRATIASVQEDSGGQSNMITLRDRVIDTAGQPPEVDPDLKASPSEGDQLMLIQFSGSVRDEWLEEIAAQGKSTVVTYLPDNAYLIWTDGPTVDKLRELLGVRPFLQWMGEFHPAYKFDPGLGGWKETPNSPRQIAVTIQFVAHDGVAASENAVLERSQEVLRKGWTVGPYRNIRVVVSRNQMAAIATLPDVVNIEPWVEPGLPSSGARPPLVEPAGEQHSHGV